MRQDVELPTGSSDFAFLSFFGAARRLICFRGGRGFVLSFLSFSFYFTVNYSDYLQSTHWRKLRGEALQAANGRCEACNSNSALCGHHLRYADDLMTCVASDIAILCESCHNVLHAETKMKVVTKLGREGTITRIRKLKAIRQKRAKRPKKRHFGKKKGMTAQQRADRIVEENRVGIAKILRQAKEEELRKVKCAYCQHCGSFKFCMKKGHRIHGHEAETCKFFAK